MKQEDKLKDMLQVEDMEIDKKAFQSMHKKMNKRIIGLVVKIVLVVAIAFGVIYYGASFALSAVNIKPNELSFKVKDIQNNEFMQSKPIDIMMRSYMRMLVPNMDIAFAADGFENKGFGKYETQIVVKKAEFIKTNDILLNEEGNGKITLDRSKLSVTFNEYKDNMLIVPTTNEFSDHEVTEENDSIEVDENVILVDTLEDLIVNEKKINSIQQLPDSSIIECSISFGGYENINIIDTLRKQYPKSKLLWAAVNNNAYGVSYGIPLTNTFTWGNLDKKYPGLTDTLKSAKQYEKYYQATLQMFKDNMDYYTMLYTLYNPFDEKKDGKEELQAKIEESKNGVSIIGVRAYMRKNDLLTMIAQGKVKGLRIVDVRLSEYTK